MKEDRTLSRLFSTLYYTQVPVGRLNNSVRHILFQILKKSLLLMIKVPSIH